MKNIATAKDIAGAALFAECMANMTDREITWPGFKCPTCRVHNRLNEWLTNSLGVSMKAVDLYASMRHALREYGVDCDVEMEVALLLRDGHLPLDWR